MEAFLSIILSILITGGGLFVLSYADYLAAQNQRAFPKLSDKHGRLLILEQTFRLPWLWPQWVIAAISIFLISTLVGLISIWLLVILTLISFITFCVILWQDIQQVGRINNSIPEKAQTDILRIPRLESARLYGLHGEYKGQILECRHNTLIGRSSQCQIRLKKSDVSSHHARIVFAHGNWYIQDMSRWGILVDGISVKAQALRNGSKIRISNSEFEFRID